VRRAAARRNAVGIAITLVTFSLGMTLAVFVAGSAAAASPTTPKSPAAHFFVLNGTVHAASDHEVLGSSAFPNFTTGAVDNYYSLARSHVDNSPFAEGTASPFDTGPIGQTAAAGNTQQPQYADARWPGKESGKATYGNQGGPYATAEAGSYRATAEASEASSGLSGPSPPSTLAVPSGFDDKLRQALSAWKATWQERLTPKAPTVPVPKAPVPKGPVPTPKPTVTTPIATVTTPSAAVGGLNTPPAPPPVVPPTLPSANSSPPSRSLASNSSAGDGLTLLSSSTRASLDPKTGKAKSATLTTSGESTLGRVTLGGGQIVINGIHVTASIANDGTPTYKVDVTIGAASIGGVPVTIDQDGVHVAGQGHGLPYQQASDALNGALSHAGIKLFLVAPEICEPTGSDNGSGSGTGTGTTSTTTTTTTTTSSDQSGSSNTSSSCDQSSGASATCDQSGGTPAPPPLPGQPDSGSCDQTGTSDTCDQSGTGGTSTGTTATTTGTTTTNRNTTTTSTTPTPLGGQSDTTTTTTSSCGDFTTTTPSSCDQTGAATGTTTTSSDQASTTTTSSSSDPLGLNTGMSNSGEETVRATGLHVVFTQPVSQGGVPAQFVEHILGEVFVDSLAVPAAPLPKLDLSASSPLASSSCLGGGGGTTSGGAVAGGGSSLTGGSTSGSTFGSASQPGSSSTGNSLPAAFASALRKPLWLLLAYVLWQAIVIATGVSLWNWRRDGAS
jgi:hypothetical protein